MKKCISYLGVFVLVCFSFFYTDKAVDIVKRNDPVMKEILNLSDNLKVDPINAIINNDEVISGLNGKKVNIDKSYQKMKKINMYKESMLVFDEILPEVSINYDKYVIKGNELKNEVALVFKVDSIDNIKLVNKVLTDKNILATFFIDGNIVKDNMDLVLNLVKDGYEIENLGYNGNYSGNKLSWTNNMIESLTNKKANYCYTEYKDKNILELCSNNKMYTIKPTINTGNYPFLTVKKNLESGSIISFDLSDKTLKELPSIISYISQKGYNIVTLDQLISENYSDEK